MTGSYAFETPKVLDAVFESKVLDEDPLWSPDAVVLAPHTHEALGSFPKREGPSTQALSWYSRAVHKASEASVSLWEDALRED